MIAAAAVDVDGYGQPDRIVAPMLDELTGLAVAQLRSAAHTEHNGLSAYIWLSTDKYSDECGLALIVGDAEYRDEVAPKLATHVALPGVTSADTAAEYLASEAWRDLVIDNRMMHRALLVGSTRPY